MRKLLLLLVSICSGAAFGATSVDSCTPAPSAGKAVTVPHPGRQQAGASADDTASIQAAINSLGASGGTVFVPAGVYMIDAARGIRVTSNLILEMSPDAVLKAIPTEKDHYSVVNISHASHVAVVGGTIVGERQEHRGNAGEWGMAVTIAAATDVIVRDLTVKDAWGDGFYVTGQSRNVRLCRVTAAGNRRQGASLISVDGMLIDASTFENTRGAKPQAGIDIEPNPRDTVSNVTIQNSKFLDNGGFGIQLTGYFAPVNNVIVQGNTVMRNQGGGMFLYRTSGHVVRNNILRDNLGPAIRLSKESRSTSVSRNQIRGGPIRDEDGRNDVFENTLQP